MLSGLMVMSCEARTFIRLDVFWCRIHVVSDTDTYNYTTLWFFSNY